jgi:hypothetical protein
MEIDGLPVHPLVIHAVVVFVPLTALVAVLYAAVPQWRWALRGVLIGLTAISVVTAVVAASSGDALLEARDGLRSLPAVEDHVEAGNRLRNAMFGFAVIALLAVWRLGGPSPLTSGRGGREVRSGSAVDVLLAVVLALAAVAIGLAAFFAGHSGATAVWG